MSGRGGSPRPAPEKHYVGRKHTPRTHLWRVKFYGARAFASVETESWVRTGRVIIREIGMLDRAVSCSSTISAAARLGDLMDYWPPILCPRCWAMRFSEHAEIAQCLYCGFVMTKKLVEYWLAYDGSKDVAEETLLVVQKTGQSIRFLGVGKKE